VIVLPGALGAQTFVPAGPPGGNVTALAVDPVSPTTVYVGLDSGGVYKSTNGGASWKHWSGNGALATAYVMRIAIDPKNPSTVYAATQFNGLQKTTDGGLTWTQLVPSLTGMQQLLAVAVDAQTSSTIYAAGDSGLFRSTDGGASFVKLTTPDTKGSGFQALYALPFDPWALFAGTSGSAQLFASVDGGNTWLDKSAGLSANVTSIAAAPVARGASSGAPSPAAASSSNVLAGTDGGLYSASFPDVGLGGFTAFSIITVGLLDFGKGVKQVVDAFFLPPPPTLRSSSASPTALEVGRKLAASQTGAFYFTCEQGVGQSTDLGATWSKVNGGLPTTEVTALGGASTSSVFVGTSASGVFHLADGATSWADASTGLSATIVVALAADPTSPSTLWAAVRNGGVFRSTDGGATWKNTAQPGSTTGSSVNSIAVSRSGAAYVANDIGLFRSTDGGTTWASSKSGIPGSYVLGVAADPTNANNLWAGGPDALYRSTNAGSSWTKTSLLDGSVLAFAFDAKTPSTLYAGSSNGLYRSTDSGATWAMPTNVTGGFGYFGTVNAIVVDPSNSRNVYAGTANGDTYGFFRSTDGGVTWANSNSGLNLGPYGSVTGLAVDPASSSTLYATTSNGGVFRSTNAGGTWSPYGAPLSNPMASALVVGSAGVFVATRGGGVVRSPAGGITAARLVPIVLDLVGALNTHFTSQLTLANRGTTTSTVQLLYTAATTLGASGSGTASLTLTPGQQIEASSALDFLRSLGLAIPTSGSQGGTLRATFTDLSDPSAAYAGARTTAPSANGRAGLAYTGTRVEDLSTTSVSLFGLRQSTAERSNIGLVNGGTGGPITLRVTLVPKSGGTAFVVSPDTTLGPGQWLQLNGVLAQAGFDAGYAAVERVTGSDPFLAYAVFNDNATQDGSFVPSVPAGAGAETQTLPFVGEGTFSTELVLANPTAQTATVRLSYVESLGPNAGAVATATDTLAPGEQRIIPGALQYLRSLGAPIAAPGGTLGGALSVSFFAGGAAVPGFAGGRTGSAGGGGEYALFYPSVPLSFSSVSDVWIYGLAQDSSSRSNLAVVNAAPAGTAGGDISVQVEVYDGTTGAKAGTTETRALSPGRWTQFNGVLQAGGIAAGYARVVRVAGSSSFTAYGVVNDGKDTSSGTNDGSFVPGEGP
jgi:photosystem II stability/assembly factor-like uncharacterized protein